MSSLALPWEAVLGNAKSIVFESYHGDIQSTVQPTVDHTTMMKQM